MFEYAELHAHSAFSFLDGANQPEELVEAAVKLGLSGLAVLDFAGFYGAIRTNEAGKSYSLPILHGVELTLEDGSHLPLLAKNLLGYRELSTLISLHNLKQGRNHVPFTWAQLEQANAGNWLILTGSSNGPLRRLPREERGNFLGWLKEVFGAENVLVEAALTPSYQSQKLGQELLALSQEHKLALVATTAARVADPARRNLADVLRAVRRNETLLQAEGYLPSSASFLRSPAEMMQLHRYHPPAVSRTAQIARDYSFDLQLLAPELPRAKVPAGHTQTSWLRHLTYQGAKRRYGDKEKYPKAWETIEHELQIIEELGFCGYFLIVWEIVQFCRKENILCQGRGSAANSAVCFCLEITAVDAVKHKMLFERFLSPLRSGPPDIDLDIEAGRREEVIQHVYQKYGRSCCAQVANVISYQPRLALRDVSKALGFSEDASRKWLKNIRGGKRIDPLETPAVPALVRKLAGEISLLPRHLGLHSGGMVLTKQPVTSLCPVQWSTKHARSCLQWDKDDCASAGLVKFDLLGLGMLTALRKAFDWLKQAGVRGTDGAPLGLYNLPAEDPLVYALLQKADTVGVFQVESRAQMNTLPRLKPSCFYDLVVEVALIRPGPIQGQAVNPYLRRRMGLEEVTYLHPLVKPALEKTLGVPIFQEQLMQISIEAAGFTPAQADQLRKAMSAKRSRKKMELLKPALMEGMKRNGIAASEREAIYQQLQGFSEFGFPESHAFSFAYIVYASAWLKVHYPAYFYASILASQPMGFYSPQTLVADANRHQVKVGKVDVNYSQVEASVWLEKTDQGTESAGVRLGLESVRGLGKEAATKIVSARTHPFESMEDLAARARLSSEQLQALAKARALESLGISRAQAIWEAGALSEKSHQPSSWYQPFLPGSAPGAKAPQLPELSPSQKVQADLIATGVSIAKHPCQLVRSELTKQGVILISELGKYADRLVKIAGIVTHRQRPHTAKGTTFLSLEDESGLANVICSTGFWQAYRATANSAAALTVLGKVQVNGAIAVLAQKISALEIPVVVKSRDFR